MSRWTSISPLHNAAKIESARRRAQLPPGALGMFGPALDTITAARGGPVTKIDVDRVVLVAFAGDHGIAYAGVSAYQPGTTAQRIASLAAGQGPVAQLAAEAGVIVRTVDVAVRGDLSDSAVDLSHHLRTASGRIDMQNAMKDDQLDAALDAGIAMANAEVDGGADLLIGAVCGVGVSTPTDALISAVTGMEPALATTRGSGIDDEGWIAKCAAVRTARFRAKEHIGDAAKLLQIAGGPDLAALTGFIAQAAARRTPVLLDDLSSLVCAVLANRLAPGTDEYVLAADTVPERSAARLYEMLALDPIASHGLRLGSGAGALLTVPALRTAARLVDGAVDRGESVARTDRSIDVWDTRLL